MNVDERKCPKCNSENIVKIKEIKTFDGVFENYICLKCNHRFQIVI